MPPYDLNAVRAELPVLTVWTYLNTGTVGVMPDPVFDELSTLLRHYEQGGHTAQSDVVEGADRAKHSLAELIGASASEIALNRNATDGINLVASTFPLNSGDEVITSTEEHPAMVLPLLAACERAGATLRFVDFDYDRDRIVANLTHVLSDRTRLVAISHVSCETGSRLPVDVLRECVGSDVAILIDASQSIGQFKVNVPEMKADFVIGNGHKWLAGPKGTGFTWVAPSSEHLVPPANVASDSFDPPWNRSHYQSEPAPALKLASGASKYEFGTRSWHLHAGLTAAIEYQAGLGWSEITRHIELQSETLKQELASIPDVRLISPDRFDDSSGLVTFAIHGMRGEEVSATLWNEYRIAQRRVEKPSSVRVSCAYFTDDEDISKIVGAVQNIARSA